MRGLTTFITDIRKCRSKEDEAKRLNKELANIRSKFSGRKILKGYDKKKYICKLIYIFFLGHKSDLGYMEAVNLLSSNAFTEKQIGYLFISIIMDEENKFTPLIINALKDDLSSYNQSFQNLALKFISNNANKAISETLNSQVFELLISTSSLPFLKQTAALTLLQLCRLTPELISYRQFVNHIVPLLNHHNLGLVTASASLVEWLANDLSHSSCVKPAVARLNRLVSCSPLDCAAYTYYDMPAPWLMVKLLRILQKFTVPADASLRCRLRESLELILGKAVLPRKLKTFESHNSRYAVIFEAIRTVIKADFDKPLLTSALDILGATLQHKEPNFRFIALDIMTQLSDKEEVKETIATYWESILGALRSERDISIRKRAVDLLYAVCDEKNVREISAEMIRFMKEEKNIIREEVTLKLATLAERFRNNSTWYIETIFEVLMACGDSVNARFWHSLVKFVASDDATHSSAAKIAFVYLHSEPCPDIVAKVAGYILGEFGHVISTYSQYDQVKQLDRLQEIYRKCSRPTRAVLLNTYMKFINIYPELRGRIQSIFKEKCNIESDDVEIQQRSVEYLALSEKISKSALVAIMDEIPPFQGREYPSLNGVELSKPVENNEIDFKPTLFSILDETATYQQQERPFLNSRGSSKAVKNEEVDLKSALVSMRTETVPYDPLEFPALCDLGLSKPEENYEAVFKPPLTANYTQMLGCPTLNTEKLIKSEGKNEAVSFKMKTGSVSLENFEEVENRGRDSANEVSSHSTRFSIPPPIEPPYQSNILIDISDEAFSAQSRGFSDNVLAVQGAEASQMTQNSSLSFKQKFNQNLLFQDSGTIYDDEVIRILIRREFDKQYGTLYLMYTNKSQLSLENFVVQGNFSALQEKCRIWFKPECSEVRPGSNFVQNIHLECLGDFLAKPSLTLKFQQAGRLGEVKVTLPLTMNMFVEPVVMSPLTFLTRWNNFGRPNQEVKKCFPAKLPMMYDITKAKLRGFRLGIVKKVSEDSKSIHGAGLFHSRSGRVGFLLILTCDSKANKYELAVRSKLRSLSLCVSNLICELF